MSEIWVASEASQLGWGGVRLVEEAIGMSHTTIRRGWREIQSGQVENLPQERSRLQGGGRKNVETIYSDLREQLDMLIDPVTRGDPESPLRWTCKSTRRLSEELQNQRIHVSHSSVHQLLYDTEHDYGKWYYGNYRTI